MSMVLTNSSYSFWCRIILNNLSYTSTSGKSTFSYTPTSGKSTWRYGDDLWLAAEIAAPIVFAVSGSIGIIGNSFVVTAYVKQYKKLNPYRILIMHLACCDLSSASIQLLWALAILNNYLYGLGEKFEPTAIACLQFGRFISLNAITIIATETYQAVQNPLRHNAEAAMKRTKKCLIAAWVIGVSLIMLTSHCHMTYCNYNSDMAMLYIPCVYTVFPLVIITFCYTMIIRKVRKKPKSGILGGLPENVVKKRQKSEMQMIIFLSLIVVSSFFFLATLTIIEAIAIMIIYTPFEHEKTFFIVYFMFIALQPYYIINNLIIYGTRDRKFLASAFCKPKVNKNNPQRQQTKYKHCTRV
eukprot:gene17467-19214_t